MCKIQKPYFCILESKLEYNHKLQTNKNVEQNSFKSWDKVNKTSLNPHFTVSILGNSFWISNLSSV